eukprot:g54702.t1
MHFVRKWGRLYQQAVEKRPYTTQCLTASALCLSGEGAAQMLTNRRIRPDRIPNDTSPSTSPSPLSSSFSSSSSSSSLSTSTCSEEEGDGNNKRLSSTAETGFSFRPRSRLAPYDGDGHYMLMPDGIAENSPNPHLAHMTLLAINHHFHHGTDELIHHNRRALVVSKCEKPTFELCWKRGLCSLIYGGIILGPFGTWWYPFLDRITNKLRLSPSTARWICFKVAADVVGFGLPALASFIAIYTFFADGDGIAEFVKKMRETFLQTFLADSAYWFMVQGFNFRFSPVNLQFTVVNLALVVETIGLSYIQEHGYPWEVAHQSHEAVPGPFGPVPLDPSP